MLERCQAKKREWSHINFYFSMPKLSTLHYLCPSLSLSLPLSPTSHSLACFQHLSQHLKYFIAYFCAVAFSSLCGNLLCNLLANQAERKGGGGRQRKVGKFWCELCYIFCQWLRIFILHFKKRQRRQSRNITSAAGSERSEKGEKKEKQRERERMVERAANI